MITSVRQIRVTKLWSYDHIYNIIWIMWQNFVGDFIDRIYDVITFISKYIYFKKDWGSHFCWHHQNLTMLFTAIYKDSKKDKIDRNYVAKYNLYLYFLIWQNLLISSEKMLMSEELKGCITWFTYFFNLLWVRYNCAKFHHCRICVTDFREGGLVAPPPSMSSPEKARLE